MTSDNETQKPILLLQSGGRDSAIAAIKLLEQGHIVTAVTFSANAAQHTQKPRERAIEISEKFPDYSWNMIDYGKWEYLVKTSANTSIQEELPRSCLLCALSKITASISICKNCDFDTIAMGYTDYQNDWAEQTPYAIELQKEELKKQDIEFILPSQNLTSKSEASNTLNFHKLSPNSLENPCCVSRWGTQPVSKELIKECIEHSFSLYETHKPELVVVDHIGKKISCL